MTSTSSCFGVTTPASNSLSVGKSGEVENPGSGWGLLYKVISKRDLLSRSPAAEALTGPLLKGERRCLIPASPSAPHQPPGMNRHQPKRGCFPAPAEPQLMGCYS